MTRILVVDDDVKTARMLVEYLSVTGYQTASEPDGLRALQHCDLRLPDMVILDLMLPVVTGVEVARRLRLDPDRQHVPIIAITGVENPEELADVLMVDAVLTKPIDLEDLGAVIESLLQSKPQGHQQNPDIEFGHSLVLDHD
jgi:DNA-binding response OmpR family regulator